MIRNEKRKMKIIIMQSAVTCTLIKDCIEYQRIVFFSKARKEMFLGGIHSEIGFYSRMCNKYFEKLAARSWLVPLSKVILTDVKTVHSVWLRYVSTYDAFEVVRIMKERLAWKRCINIPKICTKYFSWQNRNLSISEGYACSILKAFGSALDDRCKRRWKQQLQTLFIKPKRFYPPMYIIR